MPPSPATVIVLRRVPFSETSLVLTLFSREFGKIQGLAKGARRPKSAFEGGFDLLGIYRIVFLPRSGESLQLLTEGKLVERFRPEAAGLRGLFAGYYLAELLDSFTPEMGPHAEVFDLAVLTLRQLQTGARAEWATLRFEVALLRALGHLGRFDACSVCGRVIPWQEPARLTESGGGLTCNRCWRPSIRGLSITGAVRKAIHDLSRVVSSAEVEGRQPVAEESTSEDKLALPGRPTGQSVALTAAANAEESSAPASPAFGLEREVNHSYELADVYPQVRGLVSHWVCHLLGRKPRLFPFLEKMGFFAKPAGRATTQ